MTRPILTEDDKRALRETVAHLDRLDTKIAALRRERGDVMKSADARFDMELLYEVMRIRARDLEQLLADAVRRARIDAYAAALEDQT